VHVTTAGIGPTLVLLHQSPLSASQFLPAFPALVAAGLQVVALDTPGFGASDPPPAPVSIIDHAEALLPVLAQVADGPVHLLGHHTGAMIGAALAARYPEVLASLILNGVPLFDDSERAFFATFRFAPVEPRADGGHLVDAWQQRLKASPGWTNLAAMHRHVATQMANPDRYHWGFEAAFAHDLAADVARISTRTLILTNSGEDLFAASQRAALLRPDWAFAALEGGTHDIVDEQPEAWAAAVAEFVLGSGA
jgi:pimeloyl-ACP methyl ester carboxylesterase